MPQDKRKIEPPKAAAPTPGFLERVFGTEKFTPEIEEGIRIAKKEMPNMAPVQPYGFFSRLAMPSAQAYVSSGRNIYLSPRATEGQTPQEIADILTHEQEHIKQKAASGIGPTREFLNNAFSGSSDPYARRVDELGAFQAEKDRRNRMGRSPSAVPSFSTGQFYVPRDIHLPTEKPKRAYEPSKPVTMR